MPFSRYIPVWSGFTGSPGYTVLHFDGSVDVADATILGGFVKDFFDDLAAEIPTVVNINYPGEMTVHADDGTLIGAVALSTVPAFTNCTGIGAYAAPAGARVTWETGSIVGGRRIRGRTFLVPMATSTFDTDGTLTSSKLGIIQTAANVFVAACATNTHKLAVWSPSTSTVSVVTSATVPDQATVLRSRRDG